MPFQKGNKQGGVAKDMCGAKQSDDPNSFIMCRRPKRHLLHHSKYENQHCDHRAIPRVWWDATPEEIAAAKEEKSRVPE